MRRIGAAFLVLGLAEERQHTVPIPANAAALPPQIVIGRVTAHVNHAVDRAGAAQHLATRLIHRAAFEFGLGLALEHPVETRVGEELAVAGRQMDPEVAVVGAGFEQQHAVAAALTEPRCHDAAGRTGTGDDIVERAGIDRSRSAVLHRCVSPSAPRRSARTWSRVRVCQRRRRPIGSFSTSG
jgi:hypothetical protein